MAIVKTTLDLPDDVMRAIKVRAARQDRRIKDIVTELLRRSLAQDDVPAPQQGSTRVEFPLIHCAHKASPDEEPTPERIAEILSEDEARWALWGEHGSTL